MFSLEKQKERVTRMPEAFMEYNILVYRKKVDRGWSGFM